MSAFVMRTGSVDRGGALVGFPSNPSTDGPGVDFDPVAFETLLKDKGELVQWDKAAFCPNRPPDGPTPRAHHVDCKVCDSTGFVYFEGAAETQVLIQAVRLDQTFHSFGRWDVGSVLVTSRATDTISYFDRITVKDGIARFTELLFRQPGGLVDRPRFPVLCVEYVSWISRAGVAVVGAPADVSVLSDGTLSWTGYPTERPDVGQYYTVSYTYRPRYVVQNLLHQRRVSSVNSVRVPFPIQAVARADFVVRDEGRDPASQVFTNPFEPR